jgi:PAS domain S-box-containing protein
MDTLLANIALLRRTLPLVCIFVATVVFGVLLLSITSPIDDLRETLGDNITWALPQVEVDVLLLSNEAIILNYDKTRSIQTLKNRFDSLHRHVSHITASKSFANIHKDSVFVEQLVKLRTSLDKIIPVFSLSDSGLRDALPDVITQLSNIHNDAHEITLTAIGLPSVKSHIEWGNVTERLFFVPLITIVLILLLAIMIFILLRQYRYHRHITAEVKHTNTQLKSSFNVSLDAIVVANDQGKILDINSAAEDVFGYSRNEAIGTQMADLIIPPQYRDAHHAGMKRFNQTKEPRLVGQGRIEITALRKSGEEFPVELAIGHYENKGVSIFISYLRDITARVAAEKELKLARDNALAAEKAKSNFLAVMSHEIRTPLNGLFGTIELLHKTKLTKVQAQYLDIAKRSSDILLHHINDVLDVSRIDADKYELVNKVFNLETFFKDVVITNETTAYALGNQIILNLKNMPKNYVLLDEHRLRQVAYNLISNALKFTKCGTVTINVEVSGTPKDGQILRFSVADTGVGIAPEDQKRVFERFYTQENSYDRIASGTGLGLTICKTIIEMMDGEIWLESDVGKGTIFYVTLPIQTTDTQAAPETTDTLTTDRTPLNGSHILLVEDNEINRVIVKEMLFCDGLIITEAINGQKAVEIASKTKFAAILMDVSMPVMNGVEATKTIRNGNGPNKTSPIIGLTAHALEEEKVNFLSAGMEVCLNKPVSHETLAATLVQAILGKGIYAPSDTNTDENLYLDSAIFSELKSIFSPEKLDEVISRFQCEIEVFLKVAPALLKDNNLTELASHAHKSVDSAGIMGALLFRQKLYHVEHLSKAKHPEGVADAIQNIVISWPATKAALELAKS